MVKQENPILELIGQSRLGIARAKEEREAVFDLTNEAMRSKDYKRAEQILIDDLYKVEFKDYQRSLETYRELRELIDISVIPEKDKVFLDYLKGVLEQKESLHNFDQRISPLILRIRKLAKGEIE